MAPSPNRCHQKILMNLLMILGRYLESHRIGDLYPAPLDVFLDDYNVFQPDILFVSTANRKVLAKGGTEGPPDFVVEILSPSTSHLDLGAKRRIYGERGVREMWVIDPVAQTTDVYRRPDFVTAHRRAVRGERLSTEIFPKLEIPVDEIFAE